MHKWQVYVFRTLSVLSGLSLIGYIVLKSTVPYGLVRNYSSEDTHVFSKFGPVGRVEEENGKPKQLDNPIYFSTNLPYNFERAKIKMVYKSYSDNQEISLGFKDQDVWHYNTQLINSPLLNNLAWPKVGQGPYLYQKNPTYTSADDFIKEPPAGSYIGTYDYHNNEFLYPDITISDYAPAKVDTHIDVPLRGHVEFYTYAADEPFKMQISKRDLNWYNDPDATKITVYKQQDKVYEATIDDDGNESDDHKVGGIQTATINNPGPGLPENGVYKVVIDSPNDSLITNITTNLHKIAFAGPVYIAGNHEIYGDAVPQTTPTTIYSNANKLNFKTDHPESVIAKVDKKDINLTQVQKTYDTTASGQPSLITVPKSDMTINGAGYFAFSNDQLFLPSKYHILPIKSASDFSFVDYVITDYSGPPAKDGEWSVTEKEFDLSDAYKQNGSINWIIAAPDLKLNNGNIVIDRIDMTMSKSGWYKN